MLRIKQRLTSVVIILSLALVPKGRRMVKQVKLEEFKLLIFANEIVGRLIWLFGSFERLESGYFRAQIRPDDVCFDVGGNIGYFTMLMASRLKSGHVHVFEPIPINAAMIELNKQLNGFKNVTVNNAALGHEKGVAQFAVSADSAFSSLLVEAETAPGDTIAVPVVRLDDYLAERGFARLDILKVDVEGAEGLVIGGAENTLSNPMARPRIILLELVDHRLAQFGTSTDALVSKLRSYGYVPHVLRGKSELHPYAGPRGMDEYNIIFTATENSRSR